MVRHRYYTISDLCGTLDPSKPVAFDIETDGLYGPIMLAQFYQPHLDFVVLIRRPDPLDLSLALDKYHLIAHHSSYEISTIQTQTATTWIPPKFDDTFFLARLVFYVNDSFSLDDVMGYVLGYNPYTRAGLDKATLQKSNWAGELSDDQVHYACLDVWHLLEVYDRVRGAESSYSYKLDMATLRHCLNFQSNGMPTIAETVNKKLAENTAALKEIGLPINSNSYKQVREYLGTEESDGLALAKMSLAGDEKAGAVRATRKLLKQNNFLGKYRVERIFGRFSPTARSGRLTCSKDNLQQIPRILKGCFGYQPGEGSVLIFADYPTIELRTIAAIVGEYRMAKLFQEGEDLHGFTAAWLFGDNWTAEQRRLAKTLNFGLLYSGGAKIIRDMLIKDAGVSVELRVLERKKRQWHKLWPAITDWQKSGANRWRCGDSAETPLGRRYFGKRLTDYLNIENQGYAAEITKLALHKMIPAMSRLDHRIKMLNFVHDSYLLSCPDEPELYAKACRIVAQTMQRAWFDSQVGVKIPNLPMPINVFVGYDWGSIESDPIYHHLEESPLIKEL